MRLVDAATSPTIPRSTHLPFPPSFYVQMHTTPIKSSSYAQSSIQTTTCPPISLPSPATYLQMCQMTSARGQDSNQNVNISSGMFSSFPESNATPQFAHHPPPPPLPHHHHHQQQQLPLHHPQQTQQILNLTPSNQCRFCLAIQANQTAVGNCVNPSSGLIITNTSGLNNNVFPLSYLQSIPVQERAVSAAPILQLNERSFSMTGSQSSGPRSAEITPLPISPAPLQRSQSARRAITSGSGVRGGQLGMGRSPLVITPSYNSVLYTSSIGGESQIESPSTAYMDNNDSVNIFNKYQTSSSGPLSDPFSSYFLNRPKRHGYFRKSVPIMPIFLALPLCILNWFLPGSGTLLASLSILCGCKTEYGREQWKTAFVLGLLAALLQFTTGIFVFGWVWSVMWGVNFIKNSTKRRNKKYEEELDKTMEEHL